MQNNQNIGQVVIALKQGKHARREGWNGKQMHIYLEDSHCYSVGDGVFKGAQVKEAAYFVLYNHQTGIRQPGWNASTPDLLATDWQILDPEETEYPQNP